MEGRALPNTFAGYGGETLLNANGKLADDLASNVQTNINSLLKQLDAGLKDMDGGDYSVYTGTAGISLLHLFLYQRLGEARYLDTAHRYISPTLRHLKGRRLSFLCGDAGPLAIGAVIYHKLDRGSKSRECIQGLESLHQAVCGDPSLPDELLYGRVGYLFALLFVQKHLGQDKIQSSIITRVYKAVLESGQALAKEQKSQPPLMFMWHEKQYFGAAHGLAGIFHTLMQVKDEAMQSYLQNLVRPSIDYMLTLQFPSGNCPSSLGNSTDKLVHWCHGAPGWIHMFVQAYKTFGDTKYLDAARKCASVLWERGLLKKGYGICHGTAGNAYGFLTMFKVTQEKEYLYKAYKFAEWCIAYGTHGCREPDSPFSLFEGMAGTIYFLADILDPHNAKFPAFEL